MPIIWVVIFGTFYCIAPYGVSLLSVRHHWQGGHPGWLNYAGLIGVAGGGLILSWVLLLHFEHSPQRIRLGNPLQGPGYVLTTGPYSFSRHPMHIAGILIWFGWALFYGSVAVGIGTVLLSTVFAALVPSEERGIETRSGDPYRQYKSRVPRWIGVPTRPENSASAKAESNRE